MGRAAHGLPTYSVRLFLKVTRCKSLFLCVVSFIGVSGAQSLEPGGTFTMGVSIFRHTQ